MSQDGNSRVSEPDANHEHCISNMSQANMGAPQPYYMGQNSSEMYQPVYGGFPSSTEMMFSPAFCINLSADDFKNSSMVDELLSGVYDKEQYESLKSQLENHCLCELQADLATYIDRKQSLYDNMYESEPSKSNESVRRKLQTGRNKLKNVLVKDVDYTSRSVRDRNGKSVSIYTCTRPG